MAMGVGSDSKKLRTKNVLRGKGLSAGEAENVTAICETNL
jgi:hypothetical protein